MGDAANKDASSCSNNQHQFNKYAPKYTTQSIELTCAICMDWVKNRAFVNSCSHVFCLSCLLRWAKHKLQCPLCKQIFSVIYYCVSSRSEFKQVPLRYLKDPIARECSGELGFKRSQLGRIKEVLEFSNLLSHDSSELYINTIKCMREDSYFFRRSVYVHNYWALSDRHMKEWLGPEFYVANPGALVRLFPWIYRELEILLTPKEHLIEQVFNLIISLLQLYEAYSDKFVNSLKPFLGEQTQHFLHELLHFIFSRNSMPVYDKIVLHSSVHFIRENSFRGAVVNGPGESESITLGDDEPKFIKKGVKRFRVTSMFPTVKFDDLIAITPDVHRSERIYVLVDMANSCLDFKEILTEQIKYDDHAYCHRRPKIPDSRIQYFGNISKMLLEVIYVTETQRGLF